MYGHHTEADQLRVRTGPFRFCVACLIRIREASLHCIGLARNLDTSQWATWPLFDLDLPFMIFLLLRSNRHISDGPHSNSIGPSPINLPGQELRDRWVMQLPPVEDGRCTFSGPATSEMDSLCRWGNRRKEGYYRHKFDPMQGLGQPRRGVDLAGEQDGALVGVGRRRVRCRSTAVKGIGVLTVDMPPSPRMGKEGVVGQSGGRHGAVAGDAMVGVHGVEDSTACTVEKCHDLTCLAYGGPLR